MSLLSSYSLWQIHMAVISSRMQLDTMPYESIQETTNQLLSRGLYNDLMLDVLEEDPIFPFKDEVKLKKNFNSILESLNFPRVDDSSARWILSYRFCKEFSIKPYNYSVFNLEDESVYDYFWFILENDYHIFQDVKSIQSVLYGIDDSDRRFEDPEVAIYFDDVNVLALQTQFFSECEK